MASLQSLGAGRWRVRVFIDGRQHSRSFEASSERAARQKMAAVEMDLRRDLAVTPSTYTVSELVADWLRVSVQQGRSPSTMRAYRMHTDRLVDRFGMLPAVELTGYDIDVWYAEMLAAGRSAATIQHTHRVVRAVLNFGHQSRDLPRVATRQAHPPAHRTPEVEPPSSETVRTLLASVRGEWGRAVRLLAMTGLRRGEVVGLRWQSIGEDVVTVDHSVLTVAGAPVHVKSPKGKRSRRVAIGPAAAAVLAEQHAIVVERCKRAGLPMSPWVFPSWADNARTPRRPDWLSLMWGRHREAHDAKTVRLHDLRHWYATTALEGGVPLSSVSAQLGHAQTSTTANIYAHATDVGRSAAATAAEQALDG